MILRKQVAGVVSVAALLLATAYADIGFSSPSAGAVISGNTISVTFTDGSGTPDLSQFTSYTLQLCAGGNTASSYTPLLTFTSTGDPTQADYTATIPDLSIGGSTTNAYFLRTLGVAPGGTVINFSDRFTLSGMTGTFSAAVQQGLASVSGTSGPPTQNQIANPPAAASGAAAPAAGTGSFAIPYTMQTGPIRYAPMAMRPGTKITAKGGPSAQYATFPYTLFTQRANLPPPDATQTVTQPETYAQTSEEATVAAASQPGGATSAVPVVIGRGLDVDMNKWLDRWKD